METISIICAVCCVASTTLTTLFFFRWLKISKSDEIVNKLLTNLSGMMDELNALEKNNPNAQ